MARVKRGVVARARHKKVLRKRRAITVRAANYSRQQNKRSLRRVNTPIVIVANANVSFVHYGLLVLMRRASAWNVL